MSDSEHTKARPGTVERAFQIARSGECRNLQHLRGQLSKEGYRDARAQIDGRMLLRQLRELMTEAAKPAA